MKIIPLISPAINWPHLKELGVYLDKSSSRSPLRILDEARLSKENIPKFIAFFALLDDGVNPRTAIQQSYAFLEHLSFGYLIYGVADEIITLQRLPQIHFSEYENCLLATATLLEWKQTMLTVLHREPTIEHVFEHKMLCSEVYKHLSSTLELQELFSKYNSVTSGNGIVTLTRR